MTTVRTVTGLAVDHVIQARVQAHNADGWGEWSEINTSGATIETLPLQMSPITYDPSASSNTAIKLTWSTPTGIATGGSSVSILQYLIEWNQGDSIDSWQTLTTVTAPTTFYLATGLTGGENYQYKILAINKYGNGQAQTTSVTIKAGQAPDAPNAPTTAVPANSVYVEISWTAPTANNFAIDKYQILIQKQDGTFYEDLTYCDGSTTTVINDLKCQVPMSVLRAAPYSLVLGDDVVAKVQAHNQRGWSGYSATGQGATVQTEPSQMSAPVRGASTSET